MESSNSDFCIPLQRLLDEHKLLKADMNLIYDITEDLSCHSEPKVNQLFTKLREKVSIFTEALTIHSRREEIGLFPMMNRHLEVGDKTIEVMEYEHEKAERHLQDFLTEAGQAGANITEDDAQSIALNAVQAHATLTQHFGKEEKMLFPMAEQILSADEKCQLDRLL